MMCKGSTVVRCLCLSSTLASIIVSLGLIYTTNTYPDDHDDVADLDPSELANTWEGQKGGQEVLIASSLTNASSEIWDGIDTNKLWKLRAHCANTGGRLVYVNSSFSPLLNRIQREQMRTLIGAFVRMLTEHNMTYFLYSGSLIGSYRHHGMVPWDDDVDIAVHIKHKKKLQTLLLNLPKPYRGFTMGPRWKMFYSGKPIISDKVAWSFPFLDISFFVITSNSIHDADVDWASKGFTYRRVDIFPLTIRPFWDMMLPAPKNTKLILEEAYNTDDCVSLTWSHSHEYGLPHSCNVPCQKLKLFYPFVERRRINVTHVDEKLMFNHKTIHSIILTG